MTDGAEREPAGRGNGGRILWLAFEVDPEGGVETRVTREGAGGLERARARFGSVVEAAERYGEGFREVVETALQSGSRRGRWRP